VLKWLPRNAARRKYLVEQGMEIGKNRKGKGRIG
jgi:hypothetical protein